MAKRKSTSQLGATSTKVPRMRVGGLRLPRPDPSQIFWPPSPPPAHPSFVPPTPRVNAISLSTNVTLSLEVTNPEESTDLFEICPPTLSPAADAPCPSFTSRFPSHPQDGSPIPTLRPVVIWEASTNTSALSSANHSSTQAAESEENEKEEKEDEVNVVQPLHEEPGIEEASECSEQDT